MEVLIRGVSPLSAMTRAELSALPRPGDVIVIEDGEEGRSYIVAGVQFDLLARGVGPDQERLLEETGMVVHVRPEGRRG